MFSHSHRYKVTQIEPDTHLSVVRSHGLLPPLEVYCDPLGEIFCNIKIAKFLKTVRNYSNKEEYVFMAFTLYLETKIRIHLG